MTDIPDAADLLAIARATLLSELIPALPGDQRYAGLMVANAMAIAAREYRLGAETARNEAARLRNLLEECEGSPPQSGNPDAPEALSSLRKAMCSAIRAGDFDNPQREAALAAQLLRTAADRVAISNPKALQR